MTNEDPNRQKLIALHKLLVKHFDLEDLRVLCNDLGVDYEELDGKKKTTKMQDLISYVERRGELQLLIDGASNERPKVAWHGFVPASEEPEGLEEHTGDIYTDAKTGLEMIRIPAGEVVYIYGVEDRLAYLPDEYWIAKTPVTNAHYVRFVSVTGHEPPKHWEGKAPKAKIANHPVVYVSWHDATAYADWAGMALPTEEEWEKAARGTDGRRYPWGNNWEDGRCNTAESGIESTSPVGQFSPRGDSLYGCVDMSGNVWEWTTSWYDEAKSSHVLCGGSWHDFQGPVRAVFRAKLGKRFLLDDLGIRVVVRRPPSQNDL